MASRSSSFNKNSTNFHQKFKDQGPKSGESSQSDRRFFQNERSLQKYSQHDDRFTKSDEKINTNRDDKFQKSQQRHFKYDENPRKFTRSFRNDDDLQENLENKIKFQESFGITRKSSEKSRSIQQSKNPESSEPINRGQFKDLRDLLNSKRRPSQSDDKRTSQSRISERLGMKISEDLDEGRLRSQSELQSSRFLRRTFKVEGLSKSSEALEEKTEAKSTSRTENINEDTSTSDRKPRTRKEIRVRNPMGRLADLIRFQVVDAVERNRKRENSLSSSVSKTASLESLIEISSASDEPKVEIEGSDKKSDARDVKIEYETISSSGSENWIDMIEDEEEFEREEDKIRDFDVEIDENVAKLKLTEESDEKYSKIKENCQKSVSSEKEQARTAEIPAKADENFGEASNLPQNSFKELNQNNFQGQRKESNQIFKKFQGFESSSIEAKNQHLNEIDSQNISRIPVHITTVHQTTPHDFHENSQSFQQMPQTLHRFPQNLTPASFHSAPQNSQFIHQLPHIPQIPSQVTYNHPHVPHLHQDYHVLPVNVQHTHQIVHQTHMQPSSSSERYQNFQQQDISQPSRTPSPANSASSSSSSSVTDRFGAPSKLEARLRKIRGDDAKFSDGNKSSSTESLKSNGFNANAKAFYPKSVKNVVQDVPEPEIVYHDSHHSFNLSPYVEVEQKKEIVTSDKLTHDQMLNLLYVTKTAPKYIHEALSYYMEYYEELGLDLCKSAVDEVLIAKGIEYKSCDFTLLS